MSDEYRSEEERAAAEAFNAEQAEQREAANRPDSEGSHESEQGLQKLRNFVDRLEERALTHIREQYEEKGEKENLAFHNTNHALGVMRRGQSIMNAMEAGGMKITERQKLIARAKEVIHDSVMQSKEQAVVQEWNAAENKFITINKDIPNENFSSNNREIEELKKWPIKRVRFTQTRTPASVTEGSSGPKLKQSIEMASTALAVQWIREIESEMGDRAITLEEQRQILEAYRPTTVRPSDFDPTVGTVIQKEFEAHAKESQPLPSDIALALADLGEAGMDPDSYLAAGPALFQEENPDMLDLKPTDLIDLPTDSDDVKDWKKKKNFRNRMIGWLKFQAVFARGRQKRLDAELASLPPNAREQVAKLFNKFDESIERCNKRVEGIDNKTTEEIYYNMMGYPKPAEEQEALAAK